MCASFLIKFWSNRSNLPSAYNCYARCSHRHLNQELLGLRADRHRVYDANHCANAIGLKHRQSVILVPDCGIAHVTVSIHTSPIHIKDIIKLLYNRLSISHLECALLASEINRFQPFSDKSNQWRRFTTILSASDVRYWSYFHVLLFSDSIVG